MREKGMHIGDRARDREKTVEGGREAEKEREREEECVC